MRKWHRKPDCEDISPRQSVSVPEFSWKLNKSTLPAGSIQAAMSLPECKSQSAALVPAQKANRCPSGLKVNAALSAECPVGTSINRKSWPESRFQTPTCQLWESAARRLPSGEKQILETCAEWPQSV